MEDIKVMSREQVRAFDAKAINELGVPGVVLMENAGRGCAEVIVGEFDEEQTRKIGIFCGIGNNGGDGYVIGRHLMNWGIDVEVIICGDKGRISGDALVNLNIFEKIGGKITVVDASGSQAEQEIEKSLKDGKYSLIVDALFGTGLRGQLRGGYADIINSINSFGANVVAVDIPSGLDCDSGQPLEDANGQSIAIKADITVTFVAVKKGFKENADSTEYTGEVYVASIGVEP